MIYTRPGAGTARKLAVALPMMEITNIEIQIIYYGYKKKQFGND